MLDYRVPAVAFVMLAGLAAFSIESAYAECGNNVVEPGETCDDGNTLAGDCCNAVCQVEVGPCNDGDLCTQGDSCSAGVCAGVAPNCSQLDTTCTVGVCNAGTGVCEAQAANEGGACNDGSLCTSGDACASGACVGSPADCAHLDSDCTLGACDESSGGCYSVDVNEGGACDDGNACNSNDVCLSGVCSQCGNGSTDGACGETCDPPESGVCDGTCVSVECGNGIVQTGEECDDDNAIAGDGCSETCQFENKLCLNGRHASVSRQAKRVAFASEFDYLGTNGDGNQEIFVFERKKFSAALKKRMKKEDLEIGAAKNQLIATRAGEFFKQLTDTASPVVNALPSLNGSGRVVAFVSTGDLSPGSPGNPDGNLEIFRVDVKRGTVVQISDSPVTVENLNPNLRAFRGNLLTFDSNGDLVPTRCFDGVNEGDVCTDNADCAASPCGSEVNPGNADGNREVFVYVHTVSVNGGAPLRQLTTATGGGDSTVGQSQNFDTRATAISTTANLLGQNPDGNSEIYRVENKLEKLEPVTDTTNTFNGEPAQAVRGRIAFTSSGDLAGANADGNHEIFLWHEVGPLGQPMFEQLGNTAGCLNAAPSTDAGARYIAFQSQCNRIPSLGNPDQSLFIWDRNKSGGAGLLPLVVRGDGGAASALPQAVKHMSVLTFESNLDSIVDPAICFLDVTRFLRSRDGLVP